MVVLAHQHSQTFMNENEGFTILFERNIHEGLVRYENDQYCSFIFLVDFFQIYIFYL